MVSAFSQSNVIGPLFPAILNYIFSIVNVDEFLDKYGINRLRLSVRRNRFGQISGWKRRLRDVYTY